MEDSEMVSTRSVIGIDPGITTGICCLDFNEHGLLEFPPILIQANEPAVAPILYMLMANRQNGLVAIEKFVTGNSAGARGHNADITRALVTMCESMATTNHLRVVKRAAADVKPWATDKRLKAAKILTDSNKTSVRHCLDSARHALFSAVADLKMKDPMY